MSIANKTIIIEQKKELETTLQHIANQLIWIERRYILKVNDDISQRIEQQESEITKVKSIIKVIHQSSKI